MLKKEIVLRKIKNDVERCVERLKEQGKISLMAKAATMG